MRSPKVFLDLDGVFADFHGAVVKHTGTDTWSIESWKILDRVPNLFLHLDVLPGSQDGFKEIVEICRAYGSEVQILTALPIPTHSLVTAPKDKITWVRKNLCQNIQVNCSAGWRNKISWVEPKAILIDDMRRNIEMWNDHGGEGIVHHGDWEKTIKTLSHMLHFA